MNFNDITKNLAAGKPKRIAVAGGENDHVIEACYEATRHGLATFVLVGDREKAEKTCESLSIEKTLFEMVDEKNESGKAKACCALWRDKKADLLMKGSVSTGKLLKEVLDEGYGLRGNGFLSHMACLEFEGRLLGMTDGGLNIAPTVEDKVKIVQNAIDCFRKLGIDMPKIALVSAVETPNLKMQSTIDAAIISKMAQRGDIKGGIVDGPFGLDNALSLEAAKIKGIDSPVAGRADVIVAPTIEAANMCAKGIIYTSHPKNGGVIIGSAAPIILLSRADDAETKYNSIILALALA